MEVRQLSHRLAVIILETALPFLAIMGWGCGHKLPDALTEIREHHREASGVVITRQSPAGFAFADPECTVTRYSWYPRCGIRSLEYGERLTREFGLKDPTLHVVERFVGELQAQLDTRNIHVLPKPVDNADQAEFGAAVAVTFVTFEERFILIERLPQDLKNSPMKLWYGVRSAVTQVKSKKTLWAEACYYRTDEKGEGPYSYGELLANKGVKMQQIIAHAAEVCGTELAAKLLASGR